ncbi:pyridoxamine 5'-phosphate oxidase family protein [Flavobacteriaceae bacterium M23B6Z8]
MITDEVKRSIDASVLCWLATVDYDGIPNVSPKEVFTYEDDETLLIGNIASPGSVKNIRKNPRVCVSFINIFIQKGFKLKGKASIITKKHRDFKVKEAMLHPIAGDEFPMASIILIKINNVQPIVAPRYHLFPGTTEARQIASAMAVYQVQPK